jgi:hypothetical protein
MVTDDELTELEHMVQAALVARDPSALSVLGFGEVSVALGWPIDEPKFVCKRMPPFRAAEYEAYTELVTGYVDQLRTAGLSVVDTEVRSVDRGDRLVAYLIQPRIEKETLGDQVLRASEPDPEHPFLGAIAAALEIVTDRISIDAQVTNFAWDGSELTLLDVGTPFRWGSDGALLFDLRPFTPMIPAPLRGVIERDLIKVIARWKTPRQVAVDVVANLYREGLESWVDPTIVALSRAFPGEASITRAEALASYEEDRKTFPRLTKLQRLERAWQTSIRKRPYEFFISDTYGDGTTL